MSDETLYYADQWNNPEYVRAKEQIFIEVEKYLPRPPKRILDIGCGYAHISEMFQKNYDSDLYLLDGDVSHSPASADRAAKYGPVENFMFYLPISKLKDYWNSRNLRYNFIDASDIKLDKDVKFDLVYSWISCGFHYPASTYKDLILRHTNDESIIIMDFRRKSLNEQIKDFDIIHRLNGDGIQKKYRLHIKFKEI